MNMNGVEGEQIPIVPAKVHLGSIGGLYKLAKDKSLGARMRLAREIGSILEADITVRESEMVADVLIDLLSEVEQNVRKALALRLSLLEYAPLRLILELARDDIEIAWPVLSTSPVLCDFDLMYIVKSQGPEYWKAIAARKVMGDRVVEMLAGTKDVETALILLENESIVLNDNTMILLSDLAQDEEVVAMPLLNREEMSKDIALSLYQYVGESIKSYITENYIVESSDISETIDQVIEETEEESSSAADVFDEANPENYMLEIARVARERGMLTPKMMIGTLRRGYMRSFIAQLEVFTNIDGDTLLQILVQSNGHGLALISKAYDISKQDFISLFMLTGRLWNQKKFVRPEDVRKALKYYDVATTELALEVLQPHVKKKG